ncbi:MAG: polysaccharide biosynthesis C-terminal domain-containing protein, partial [Bacteroidetes bacterium]|nr:polysaccharide biosynthesis C-terminal domain-containing protein [Bacteroidota bacterium]
STLEIGDRKQNFNTPFLSIIISSSFFSAIILLLSKPIGGLIALPEDFSRIIIYSAIILFLDAIVIIPFASLRQTGKAKKFALIKFLNILINVSLNIILLVKFKLGVEGIFISGLAASAMTVVILLSDIFKNFRFNFSAKLFKELLKFGLPSLPAGLAAMMLQVIDRPILRYLTDDSSVGIYQANYRLGIFMMLVVSMFDYAWKPFFFSTAKEQNAKDIFARITTYFLLGMATVFILITLLIENIVKFQIYGKFIIHPDYWSGLNIVPIILLAYLFNGLSLTFSAGIYIQKKTSYLPFITLIAAIANVVFNFLLIPMLGIIGAAFATLISYVVMAVTMYYYSQKFYRIEYEYKKFIIIAAATSLITAVYYLLKYSL